MLEQQEQELRSRSSDRILRHSRQFIRRLPHSLVTQVLHEAWYGVLGGFPHLSRPGGGRSGGVGQPGAYCTMHMDNMKQE